MKYYNLFLSTIIEDCNKQNTNIVEEIPVNNIPEGELVCVIEDICDKQMLKSGHLKDMLISVTMVKESPKEVTE